MIPAAPPANIEAEMSVLGTLLAYYTPELIVQAQATGMKREDFSLKQHRTVYGAILKLHACGDQVDSITVRHLMDTHDVSDERTSGLLAVLCASAVPSSLREHARVLAVDGRWRRRGNANLEEREAIQRRNESRFQAALAAMREDTLPGELRLVKDDAA